MSDLRLAAPALGMWVAAGVLVGMPAVHPAVVVGAWLLALAATGAAIATRRRSLAVVAVGLAGLALMATVVGVRAAERHPEQLSDSGTVALDIETGETAIAGADRVRGTVVLADGAAVRVPVLLFASVTERIALGSTVRLRAPLERTDPGDDVAYLVFADTYEVVAAPNPVLGWGDGLRERFLGAVSALPGDGAALLPGLAIGDTSAVGADLDAAMKASSLSHLTAVSGSNCAVVVGLVMLGGRALGVARRWRVLTSLAVLAAFVVLVTPQPSVLRAAVMAGLVLLATLGGRLSRGVPILSGAVVVLLVADPWLARDYGFVLSVLATGALLLLAEPLARRLARWVPLPLALVIAVPVSAQLLCQPVLILLEPSVPVYGVVANLLAEPAAPVATVAGLVACIAASLAPPIGAVLAWVAWAPSAWIAGVARFFSGLPAAELPWLGGIPGVVLLAGATAGGLVAVLGRGRPRAVAAATTAVLLAGVGAVSVGTALAERIGRPDDWQYAACDVGQGDAFVIRSAGEVALVDTGPRPDALEGCLDDLGIDRVDLLVLTHYDVDHIGGVGAVAGRVDRVISSPPDDGPPLPDLGARVEQVTAGDSGMLGLLRWRVLWPEAGADPGNDASVVLAIDCASGCLTGLFLGDLGAEAQAALLRASALGPVDVVKVAHHGSADQDAALYQRAHATVGLIGVGAENGYGHPTEELLDTLALAGTTVARTDHDGIALVSPGTAAAGMTLWTRRDGGGD